jgi:serine/threonine protein kinase
LTEKAKNGRAETLRQGLTGWLRHKLPGKDKALSLVDTQFLSDVSGFRTIGRYEIIRKLGQGSMGAVYLGRDPYIKRNVSIKVSRPPAGDGKEKAQKYRERFFVEAQSAGNLVHPNIVSIYDAGIHKNYCYMTMEYIDGHSLKKYCQKGNLLPVKRVAEIVFSACQALDCAHQRGVIHRDIKPSNMMINTLGDLKITDFGIAQIESEQMASKGIIGTPYYMSPEQVRERPVDSRSDIFSLGCVLYELLTGKKAFPGDNDFAVMYKIVTQEPVPIRKIQPDLPEILERITAKALSREPDTRYQTCKDFAYDLMVALRGLKGVLRSDRAEDVVDYVRSVPFFKPFTKDQVKEVLKASHIIRVPKGEVAVAEGEIDDSFFVILSGMAAVQKNHEWIAHIGTGECFGEMAPFSGQVRTATVLAETDCVLMKISATLLDKSSESIQLLFLKNFTTILIRRLSKSIGKKN